MSDSVRRIAKRFREMLEMDPGSSLSVLRPAIETWANELEEASSESVHIVQLMYTSPSGYSEDRNNPVAAFSTEERARLFVEWAERQRDDIFTAYHRLSSEGFTRAAILERIQVPEAIKMSLPESDYGTDHYHFQYDDEYDLDPEF